MNTNEKLILIRSKLRLLIPGIVLNVIFSMVALLNRANLTVHIVFMSLNALILLFMLALILNMVKDAKEIDTFIKTRVEMINSNIEKAISNDYAEIEDEVSETGDPLDNAIAGLYKLGVKMNADEKKSKEYMEFIRESIANVSHDLKTPLSSIRGYAEGLLDNVADTEEKKEQYSKMIINKVGTITSLLSELTYYSSIDTDSVLDVILPVSVKEYFDDCADEISPELQMKHINFTYINTVNPSVRFCIDVQKISKVVKNIIGNSIKFVDFDQGIILLKVEEKGDLIEVSIQDNGKGVPEEKLPLIFERYYKADTARSSGRSGSGIGLSIVKKIVEDHGGQVFADSKEGLGTIISFTLHKYYGEG